MLVESRMRGNVHVRFGGRERGNGAGATRSPRPLPTRHIPFDRLGANLFFHLVSRRYEHGSILLTSNKNFGAWGEVFGDPVLASAILDRILHHSVVINVRGKSYRLKEKLRAGLLAAQEAQT